MKVAANFVYDAAGALSHDLLSLPRWKKRREAGGLRLGGAMPSPAEPICKAITRQATPRRNPCAQGEAESVTWSRLEVA
jgi:hypothetical protein